MKNDPGKHKHLPTYLHNILTNFLLHYKSSSHVGVSTVTRK